MTITNTPPEVGTLATYGIGSDLYPMIVTRVSKSGKTLWARRVSYTITEAANGAKPSERRLSANAGEIVVGEPTGEPRRFYCPLINGGYRPSGGGSGWLTISDAVVYTDPSF